jgi:hypothetical protein
VTISAANSVAQTVESQTFGASNLGNTSGTSGVASGGQVRFLFAGGNNVTLSQSINGASGTITIIGPAAVGASAGTQSGGTGTIQFVNSNGISFGMSNSSQITASYTVPTETPFGMSAGTQSVSTGTVSFANSNGISFGMSGSNQITASYTVPNVPAQTVESQTLGVSNLGNTVGTSGVASGGQVQFLFAGGNNVTLSQSINGASGTITISAANSAAQTVESQTLGISNLGNTSGTSGVVSAGQVRMLFAGGNNTLSRFIQPSQQLKQHWAGWVKWHRHCNLTNVLNAGGAFNLNNLRDIHLL